MRLSTTCPLLLLVACIGETPGKASDNNAICNNAEKKYKDMADLQKYTISKSCAFSLNNCHFDEDPPTMHTVGAMWQMIGQPCNQGVPEETDWDPFCTNGGVHILAGNADESYLMIRLRAGIDGRTDRSLMPFGTTGLSEGELYALEAWINGLTAESTTDDPIDYAKTPCPL